MQRLSDHVIVAMKLAPGDHCELVAESRRRSVDGNGEKDLTIAVKLFYHGIAGHAVDIARDTGSEVSGSGTARLLRALRARRESRLSRTV